jgi:hypothetical protein
MRCPECGSEIAPGILSCPSCARLLHADPLKAPAGQAQAAEQAGMQFDRAEPVTPAAPPVCARCRGILSGTYYTVVGRSLCSACGRLILGGARPGFDPARFLKASASGIAAVFIGGGVNWLIASHFDVYVGILAFFAAFLVGFAVRWGSGNRGGRAYQVLAVLLTYVATAAMFIPIVAQRAGTLNLGLALQPFWFLIAAPFIIGMQGILLWLILGVAISQAWRVNRSVAVDIRGPYPLGSTMPPDAKGGV